MTNPSPAARRVAVVFLLAGLAFAASCGMQDASTPVPQPDSQLFGRVAGIRTVESEPGVRELEIKAGLPDSLQAVMRREGRMIPEMEKDLLIRVRVTPESVCVVKMLPADLDAFRIGQEVAVFPVPGTSTLTGTKLLQAEAAAVYDFAAYETQYLPRALAKLPEGAADRQEAARVNSSGLEQTPIPLRGGTVVYFAAGLLPPLAGDAAAAPRGAVRAGMRDADGTFQPWAVGGFRPYRTALMASGWETPAPVDLGGIGLRDSARITWVDEDETSCLVEITHEDGTHELRASSRGNARLPWGPLGPIPEAKGPSVGDAQRFGKGAGYLVWTVYDGGSSNLWLHEPGKESSALDPRINTMGPEWAPRVGPKTTLYFCRGDRQLLFGGGVVQAVRLPGTQRRPLLEAAPTADGSLLFMRVPRYAPAQIDWDIAVARRDGEAWGAAVLLDDWRP